MSISRARFLICALILSGLVASPAFAQSGAGLKGGLVVSRFWSMPDVSSVTTNLKDLTGGVFVVTNDGPVAAQIEALLTRRGAAIDGDVFNLVPGNVVNFGDIIKIRGTYLDASALLRGQWGYDRIFYVFGGPTIGFKLKAEVVGPGFSEDLDAVTEDIDLAATFGVGADLNHIVLEGRYSHGLRDVVPGVDAFGVQIRHRSVSLMVGVRF